MSEEKKVEYFQVLERPQDPSWEKYVSLFAASGLLMDVFGFSLGVLGFACSAGRPVLRDVFVVVMAIFSIQMVLNRNFAGRLMHGVERSLEPRLLLVLDCVVWPTVVVALWLL